MKCAQKIVSTLLVVAMLMSVIVAFPASVNAVSASDIKASLDAKMQSSTFKPGNSPPSSLYRTGTSGCYGFVDLLCRQIFGHNLPSVKKVETNVGTQKMELVASVDFTQIGSTLSNKAGNLNSSNLSDLFSKAQVGDVVQMDYTKSSGNDSLHTMMVYSVSSNGVVLYHAGSDDIYFGSESNYQTIWGFDGYELTWSKFISYLGSSDDGISIYRSNSSTVNIDPNPDKNPDLNSGINPDDYTYPDPNTTGTFYYTSPTMKDGNGNTYVSWIQAVLYQLGYSIEIDGSYGQKTEATVRQFQSDNGLEVDGRVGPATKRKLLELWNAKKVENSHTCDKNISSYQSAHPHYLVYKCSVCGEEQLDTTKTQRLDSCNSCLPEKPVLTVVPGTDTEQTKFTWKAAGGADCYELKIFKAGDETPLHWLFNLTTTQYELLLTPGDYVGYVVSLNIDLIDTSNYFVYSDKVEFSVLEDEVLVPFASVEYNGNRYELFDVTMSWTEAKSKCAELGGHLVTISSEEEMDKIMSIVSVGEMATYWIGYSDEDTEDYWRSVTGEEITYTNWDVGQPDDYNNAEDYALIKNQPNGKWNDVKNEYSDVPVGFICEYEGVADEDNPTDSTEPSTGDEDKPIAPTEPSTNDEDKPTESTEPSTDDEYKPTQPANPSTGDEDKPTTPVVLGFLGDANEDGKVNIKDATLIQKAIANLTELTGIGESLADADLNTKINIKDATAIQKHIAGIETGYPIGKVKTK